MPSTDQPPLVVHIIHRLSTGGLENGLVNLINRTPPERYRHAIVCVTNYTDFRDRIQAPDVPVIALDRDEGRTLVAHRRLWRVLKTLRPRIVHTRNLSSLEYLVPAALAGIPGRIHGEHGRDINDLDGANFKYNLLRRAIAPLVHRYTTVSTDLASWLVRTVGVRADRVTQILNGVDAQRFRPRLGPRAALGPENAIAPGLLVVGTVGRMQAVKDQVTLVRAFLHLVDTEPRAHERLRLVMIGDGPLRHDSLQLLRAANAEHLAWLPGQRSDIPEMMCGLDVFVLPSLREGISNTVLEAMACGLPVVATRVGGTAELVDEGRTGMLVPPSDPIALAAAIRTYLVDPEKSARHGRAGRKKIEAQFSLEAMVDGYLSVYDAVLRNHGVRSVAANADPDAARASTVCTKDQEWPRYNVRESKTS